MTVAQAQKPGLALITGAASGMGEAAARLMAEAGWPLLLCDLDADRLARTAAGLGANGAVKCVAGDLSSAAFANVLAEAIGNQPLGAVIHCAGLSPTMAAPDRILEVNLGATLRLMDVVRPRLVEGGCAVLFASSAALVVGASLDEVIAPVTTPEAVANLLPLSPAPGMAYVVSKRAVQLVAKREAAAFGRRGARIATISPGIIDTPMGRVEMEQQAMMRPTVENSPLRRVARPEEVAAVAVFLCSPAASFITGTDILVDGGAFGAPAAQG